MIGSMVIHNYIGNDGRYDQTFYNTKQEYYIPNDVETSCGTY